MDLARPTAVPGTASRGPGDGPRSHARRSRRHRKALEPLFYIAPTLVLLAGIYVVPLADVLRLSFADAHLLGGFREWVGLEQFRNLVNRDFAAVLWRTALWVGVTVPLATVLGLGVALLLNKPMPMRGVVRVIVILPWLFPEALVAIIWNWVLHSRFGLLNTFLLEIGVIEQGINFLSLSTALPTVIGVRVWRGMPFMIITLLAALQSIDSEIEEAAAIDGATSFRKFWHITLPLIAPVMISGMVILGAWTLVIFDLVFVLTGGGPVRATEIISITIYREAFTAFNIGQASAVAVVSMVFVALMGWLYIRSSEQEEGR